MNLLTRKKNISTSLSYFRIHFVVRTLALMAVVFLFGFLLIPSLVHAQECEIEYAKWVPKDDDRGEWSDPEYLKDGKWDFRGTGFYDDENRPEVIIEIKTENCKNETLQVSAGRNYAQLLESLRYKRIFIPEDDTLIEITLKTNEEKCSRLNNPDCDYLIGVKDIKGNSLYDSYGKTGGALFYDCDGDWCGEGNWGLISIKPPLFLPECQISAKFEPSGRQHEDWYSDSEPPVVKVHIQPTIGCIDIPVKVSIKERDEGGDDYIDTVKDVRIEINEPNKRYTLTMKAGEEECDEGYSPNCEYYISYQTGEYGAEYQGGELSYMCDDDGCDDENWQFNKDTDMTIQDVTSADATIGAGAPREGEGWWFYVEKVIKEDGKEVAREKIAEIGPYTGLVSTTPDGKAKDEGQIACEKAREKDNVEKELERKLKKDEEITRCFKPYELLAPLPKIGKTFWIERGLGNYINRVFMLAIGIAGVLAVIMIVIGGIQYMTTDIVFTKEEARKRIGGAIWGLLLALGTFMILNTINPDILNLEFAAGIKPAVISFKSIEGTYDPKTGEMVCGDKKPPGPPNPNKPQGECTNCKSLDDAGIPTKVAGKQVNANFLDKLVALKQAMPKGWEVTEAWPPTPGVKHCYDGHYDGTSIDVAIESRKPEDIKAFSRAASQVGLRAEYEVRTRERSTTLQRAGVTGVKVLGGHITAEHFSVYFK